MTAPPGGRPASSEDKEEGPDPTVFADRGAPVGTSDSDLDSPAAPAGTFAAAPTLDATQMTAIGIDGGWSPAGPLPGTVIGDFEIGGLLGQGGMGAVYAGRQLSLDRSVAIKILPPHLSAKPDFRRRFALEARAVAKISSPHVVQVYGAGEHAGHHYFAMEYVQGCDLAQLLKEGYRPSRDEAVDLLLQAARGLQAAGEQGIVHRDVKPGNMMVTDDRCLKLMDFGLVKLAAAEQSLTMTGTVMGTVTYFSPEQGRGEECDQRTDLYALGVVLYELLTGRLPFTGKDASSVIYQHNHSEPRLPREIDPAIPEGHQAVILKCLQKNPANRYQTATALVEDLQALRAGQSPRTALFDPEQLRTGATVTKTRAFRVEKRSSLLPVLGFAVLVGVAAFAVWFLQEREAPDDRPRPTPEPTPAVLAPTTAGVDQHWLDQVRGLLRAEQLDQAETAISALDSQQASDPRVVVLLQELGNRRAAGSASAARQAMQAGDPATAAAALEQLITYDPRHPEVAVLRADLRAQEDFRAELAALESMRGTADLVDLATRAAAIQVPRSTPASERTHLLQFQTEIAELRQRLQEARQALADADLAAAERSLTGLSGPAGQAEVSQLQQWLTTAQALAVALAAAELDEASAALQQLQQAGAPPAVQAPWQLRLRRQRLEAEIAAAEQAGAPAEADAALQRLHALDPARAAELQAAMLIQRGLAKVEAAVAHRDLAAAQHALLALRALPGCDAAVATAEAAIAASRLQEEQQQQALASALAAIEAQVQEPKPDFASISAARQAVLARFGAEVDIKPLDVRIQGRRDHLAVQACLQELDAAVLAGNQTRLVDLIADTAHRDALQRLIGRSGLTFHHHLDGLQAEADTIRSQVRLATSMTGFPTSELLYVYRWQRSDAGLRLAGVEKPPSP